MIYLKFLPLFYHCHEVHAQILDSNKVCGIQSLGFIFILKFITSSGSGKLQEWVEIEGVGDRAPTIRFPHPMTAVQFEGSKKRRRAAIGSFTCSVGDKVDAWIQDRFSYICSSFSHSCRGC